MDDQQLNFIIDESEAGKRLDSFLAERIDGFSRSRIKRLIQEGEASINGNPVKSSHRLRAGEVVRITLSESIEDRFEPEDIPLDMVFEDEYLAVINKPSGMVVHPGAGVSSGTLANAIAHHFKLETGSNSNRVGFVHRLDKDTSGLIVVAKNELTAEKLSAQFHDRRVKKSYVALVHGFVRRLSGKIEEPIARDRSNRTKMSVDKKGRSALTIYRVRQRFDRFTLLDVEIKTGRTHQIRVHLEHINHPIVGDLTYNRGRDNQIPDPQFRSAVRKLGRFFLHAEKLEFIHPVTKKNMGFDQGLPRDLVSILEMLEEEES